MASKLFGPPASASGAACSTIWALATLASLRALSFVEHASFAAPPPPPSLLLLAFRAAASAAWAATLAHSYLDKNGLQISHRGRVAVLRHSGRFVTFTLWCNCVLFLYWLSATACSACVLAGGAVPARLGALSMVLWEVAFPLSWLVAVVVTYVLIPVAARREPHKVDVMLRWRPQVLHNGYVLAAAVEVLLAQPPMARAHFPLMTLFGTSYIAFAWLVHRRLGVYAYFFLDPSFSWAPLAYAALLLATTGCFVGCELLTEYLATTATPLASGALVLLAALSTCTWRKPASMRSPHAPF